MGNVTCVCACEPKHLRLKKCIQTSLFSHFQEFSRNDFSIYKQKHDSFVVQQKQGRLLLKHFISQRSHQRPGFSCTITLFFSSSLRPFAKLMSIEGVEPSYVAHSTSSGQHHASSSSIMLLETWVAS